MNRDPSGFDCTKDPIFLLQSGRRQWTQVPSGMEFDDDALYVDDEDEVDEWIKTFIDDEGVVESSEAFWKEAESVDNDNGWPFVVIQWNTEGVFLTRTEAEAYGEYRKHWWDKWRVYCVPCLGELADVLNRYEPEAKEMVG